MTATTNLKQLKLNVVTQQQYDSMTKNANELYAVTDASISYKELSDKPAVTSLPTAVSTNEGDIYQYIGVTDQYYTHGYFYECVSDGAVTPTYSWEQLNVQPGGGSGLPSQTGNAGKFLTTDGTDASWSDKPLVNKDTASTGGISIGMGNTTSTSYNVTISGGNNINTIGGSSVGIGYQVKTSARSIAIGANAEATSGSGLQNHSIAIGIGAKTTASGAIQIGGSRTNVTATNSDADTFKVANTNGNFEIMSADGTIPTDRFTTTPSTNGSYVPTLTILNGTATRSWGAASSGSIPTLTWYNVSTAGNTLTIADTSSAQLVKIYKNGLLLEPTADYSISGTTLTMVTALVVGDKITTEVF